MLRFPVGAAHQARGDLLPHQHLSGRRHLVGQLVKPLAIELRQRLPNRLPDDVPTADELPVKRVRERAAPPVAQARYGRRELYETTLRARDRRALRTGMLLGSGVFASVTLALATFARLVL